MADAVKIMQRDGRGLTTCRQANLSTQACRPAKTLGDLPKIELALKAAPLSNLRRSSKEKSANSHTADASGRFSAQMRPLYGS